MSMFPWLLCKFEKINSNQHLFFFLVQNLWLNVYLQILHFHFTLHFDLWPRIKGKVKKYFILYNFFVNVLPILKFGKICNFRTLISIWVSPLLFGWHFFCVEDGILQSKWKCIYSKWNIWDIMNGKKEEENIIELESEKKILVYKRM